MDPVTEVEVSRSPAEWLQVIVMNLAVLTELCVSMYLATARPDDFTATFIKCFFGMLAPTLFIGAIVKRRLRPTPTKA